MTLDESELPMTTYKLRYETPLGTFATYEEAATACERCDLDSIGCIKIVVVVP